MITGFMIVEPYNHPVKVGETIEIFNSVSALQKRKLEYIAILGPEYYEQTKQWKIAQVEINIL
jgi:hypothetical protein